MAVVLVLPANALAAVRITKVQYDSPGSDTGSKSSLNAEWVKIKNKGSKAVSLSGWTLRDTAGHVYSFGSFKLKAGRTVTVHTGKGSNGSKHRYWGSGAYIWNNDGDTAKLKKGTKLKDKCKWAGGESPNPPVSC
jgi:Lamin Tail Domain